MSAEVDWSTIDENTFNQVVQALLVAEYSRDGFRARAIDGRGGDQGIDVGVWNAGEAVVGIFQLKHYRDGWSTNRRNRRTKIRESFERAITEHAPQTWTLVTASNPTLSEQQMVRDLRGDRPVKVDTMGPAELDALLAAHPRIHDRFFGDRTLNYLTALGRPEEALRRSGDVPVVMGRIYERIRARSQWWGTRVTLDVDGSTTQEIVALTPDAAEQEPLEMSFTAVFGADQAQLRSQLEQSMDYGLIEPITFPATVIGSLIKNGPEWWAGQEELAGLSMQPLDTDGNTGLPISVSAHDSANTRLGSIDGTVRRTAFGDRGYRIVADMTGGMEMTWQLPHDLTATGSVATTIATKGQRARDVRRLGRFLSAMQGATQVWLRIGDREPLRLTTSPVVNMTPEDPFVELLDDLIAIEDMLDVTFTIPVDQPITADDRIWARVLIRVLSGVAVAYPGIDGYNFTLNGRRGIAEPLEQEDAALLIQQQAFAVELLGTEVHIGHVFIYQPFGHMVNGRAHAAALRAGKGEGRVVRVRAHDDYPFLLYSPDRLPSQNKPPKVVAWGVKGIPEHHKLTALRARQRQQRAALPGPEAKHE